MARVEQSKQSKLDVRTIINKVFEWKRQMIICVKRLQDSNMCADDYSKLVSLGQDIERRIWNLQDADLLMRRPFVLEAHRYDD